MNAARPPLPRDFLAERARSHPAKCAYVDGDRRRTWAEVHERTDRLAAALQALGVRKGEAVAILAHDHVELVEHWHACSKIGAVRVGINWRYSADEMLHILRDSDTRVLLVQARCVPSLESHFQTLRQEGRKIIGFGAGHAQPLDYEDLLRREGSPPVLPDLDDLDVIAISYTSGTTGLPKGAEWTQRGVREALVQTFAVAAGLREDDVWFAAFPGAGVPILQMVWNMVNGATVVLPDGDFAARRFLELAEEHGVTATLFVPTMLLSVLDEADKLRPDLSKIRLVCYGSMSATSGLIRRALDTFGCEFQQWYGATEGTGGWYTILPHEDHLRGLREKPHLLSSCGRPLPHVELSVRDENGREVEPGTTGEVWVKGDFVMRAYRNMPAESAAALCRGWLRTGDLGRTDEDGYLYILDRKHFLIISGGYNVYPVVVENVLSQHPDVREVSVVGAPHPKWGEAVVAVVSLRESRHGMPAELIAFCRDRLAKWEVPKHIEILPDLPKGATGKILKRSLRDRFREAMPDWHASSERAANESEGSSC